MRQAAQSLSLRREAEVEEAAKRIYMIYEAVGRARADQVFAWAADANAPEHAFYDETCEEMRQCARAALSAFLPQEGGSD
jgi:hypothetical protein